MSIYTAFGIASGFIFLIYNLLHWRRKKALISYASRLAAKHFKSNKKTSINRIMANIGFWVFVEILLFTIIQGMGLITSFLFGDIVDTGANYFGVLFFAPIMVVAVCLVIRLDPLAQLDLITPAFPLGLAISKIGCLSGGCCRGVEWEHGLYNPFSNLVEFPSPLLESGIALLIFLFLLIIEKKLKKGTVFPVYLMAYSVLRFLSEFTRCEPEVFLGLKTYHWFCVAGLILGAVEYFVVVKYKDRIVAFAKPRKNKKKTA